MRTPASEPDAADDGVLHGSSPPLGDTLVERVCLYLSCTAIVVMLAVMTTDVLTRWLLHFSFEISDELSSYCLVAVTFLSLSVCQAHGSFHSMELIQSRLPARTRDFSRVLFDLLMVGACLILLWQYCRLEISSWNSGTRAPTLLQTPLWLPQSVMAIGALALTFSVLRNLAADARRLVSGKHGPP